MFLAAANQRLDLIENEVVHTPCPSSKWRDFPYSCISHHGTACCDVAREWVLSMDYAQLNGNDPLSGPRWLRVRYEWGPSTWPIHWCEAVKRKTLDCGALACLAHQAFTARGVTSFPAQFVQQYSEDATSQWRCKWDEDEVSTHWIDGEVIYHEGCAVVGADGDLKLWDASAGWWVNHRQTSGYGALLAVRVFDAEGRSFNWGEHRIAANEWNRVETRA
jgi:hypothetical protein